MALDPSIFSMANRPTVALENPMDIAMKQMAMQQAQQQLEATRMDAQAKRDAMARQAQTRQAVSTSGGDLTKAIKAAMDAGDWETADKMTMALKAQQTANATFQKTIREMDTAKREQTLKDMQEFVRIASPLTKVTDPAKFRAEAQKIAAQFDPDGSKGWGQLAQTLDPMKLKQIVDQTMDHKTWIEREFPKEQKVPLTPHAGIGPDGKPGFFQLDENGRIPAGWKPTPSASATLMIGGGGLTPEAEAMLVDKYRKTGALDADLGRNQVLRARIINAAAAADKAEGNTTDLAQNKQTYAADKESLKKIQANRDMLVSFESTALKNLGVFEAAAKKVIDSGSPLLNKPLRAFAGAAAGSPEQAVYTAARQIVIPEFAKINSGSLNGVLSDSARHEVAALIPENATLGQIMATANLLKTDAHNRRTSMDDMIKEIKGRGKGGGESKPYAGRSLSKDAIAKIATQKGMTYAQAEKQFTDGGGVVK